MRMANLLGVLPKYERSAESYVRAILVARSEPILAVILNTRVQQHALRGFEQHALFLCPGLRHPPAKNSENRSLLNPSAVANTQE